MGMMDLFNQGDVREKLYAAAAKNNVPQGGITGKLFSAMFPHGLGNLAFGREPEPMPPLETPEGTALMADLASNMMVPGTFIGPKGLARLFGDDAAKGMLATAESKLAQGVPKETVFQELGVFKGPEGKWRYELDDSGARIATKGDGYQGRLPSVLEHDDVFSAYPDARKVTASFQNLGSDSGRYSQPSAYTGEEVVSVNPYRGDNKSTLLHELQHAVQEREGFARGGSPDMAFRDKRMWGKDGAEGSDIAFKMLKEKLKEMSSPQPIEGYAKSAWGTDTITPEIERAYREYVNGFKSGAFITPAVESAAQQTVAQDWYMRLAGEAEARAVQDRMNMNMDERRALFPEYAGRNDLIVRGNSGGGLMAAIGDDWMPKAERIKKLRGFVFDSQNSKSPDRVSIRNWNDTIAKLEREVLEMGGEVSPKLVGYEWRNMDGEVHSKWEDGVVAKKVSDWDRKETSGRSNRDIVHVYWIRGKDGTAKPFGKQSAMKELVESGAAVDERHAEFLLKRMKEQGM